MSEFCFIHLSELNSLKRVTYEFKEDKEEEGFFKEVRDQFLENLIFSINFL